MKNPERVVAIKLPESLWNAIEYTQAAKGMSKTQVLRGILMQHYGIDDLTEPYHSPQAVAKSAVNALPKLVDGAGDNASNCNAGGDTV